MSKGMKFRPAKVVPARRQPFVLANRQETVEELTAPIKSESDKKLYKVIKLQNGLRALLISEPTSAAAQRSTSISSTSSEEGSEEESSEEGSSDAYSDDSDQPEVRKSEASEEKLAACALCVGVGSYSDPPHIQGLAHFVEHMVFMGSEKYPKENDFDSFIKKKGGSDNAQTDCEYTSFHFEIQEKYLLQALDRFSQFFVKPLMKKEAMQREREAIQSEFAMAVPSNSNRKDQILSSFFPPGHPARTFTWGNLRSLKDMISDDELYREAHRFRERHYSAHRMTVAIQARMNLETLEQYTIDTFGQIPTNSLAPDNFTQFKHSANLVTPEFKSMYLVKPVGDTTEVHLTWVMRSLMPEYESKPDQYISFLLGHEGYGSLLSYLRNKVWALGINSGNSASGIDYTSMYSLFSTQIMLTQSGLENIDLVLEAVFSYISMIRKHGPNKRIFDEIKTVEDVNFRFEEEQQPAEYVEGLCENMQFYPPLHYITGDTLYYKYDPEGIQELINMMTVDSVNILLLSGKHKPPVQYDQTEEWFGTEYKKMELPAEWTKHWTEVEPYQDFHLPHENPYISTDFDLIPIAPEYLDVAEKLGIDLLATTNLDLHRKESAAHKEDLNIVIREKEYEANVKNFRLDQPNLLRKNNLMEVWYKPDFKFRMPTALLYFYFITPLSLKSAKDACLLDLWNDVLAQGLREPLYPADMASLSQEIYAGDKGLTVKISGYSQKLHLVAEEITREMRESCDKLTDSLFEAVRDVRRRSYHNTLIKPAKLSKDVRMELLLSPYVSLRRKAEAVDTVTLEDLKNFHERFLKHFYMQVLIQGNVPWYEALRIAQKVQSDLQFTHVERDHFPEIMVHELPLGVRTCRVSSFNLENPNSIITNYYQSGLRNEKDLATLEVLMMLMEEPVFDRLRTKEQLGYSVFSMMRYTFGILGYSVTVNAQADKHSARYVDGRMEAFLKKFARDMKRLPDKAFQASKQALVQLKHTADVELREEADRNWREVLSREYVFDRLYSESAAIEALKLSDMKTWFVRHTLSGDRTNLRKLSVQIVGTAPTNGSTRPAPAGYGLSYLGPEDASEATEDPKSTFIYNIEAFKASLPKYPLPQIQLPDC